MAQSQEFPRYSTTLVLLSMTGDNRDIYRHRPGPEVGAPVLAPSDTHCRTAIMYDGLEVSILSSNAALHSTQVSPMGLPMRFEIRSQVTVL